MSHDTVWKQRKQFLHDFCLRHMRIKIISDIASHHNQKTHTQTESVRPTPALNTYVAEAPKTRTNVSEPGHQNLNQRVFTGYRSN